MDILNALNSGVLIAETRSWPAYRNDYEIRFVSRICGYESSSGFREDESLSGFYEDDTTDEMEMCGDVLVCPEERW